ncbi:methylated-DNA--[protein]-cysteine S-methyltransferase [Streptomyces boninensis]|uniref:methylated-DNA--[protein]-cysteine S-methyltransferase n=1 Tax=Streptomyces boninensis TaxID=2039455 RepID=UPI003B21BE8C
MKLYTTIDSPLGELLLVGTSDNEGGVALTALSMPGKHTPVSDAWRRDDAAFAEPAAQLRAYFAGDRRTFDLALAPEGTDFQQKVWRALDTIPYGTTTTYGELATSLDVPREGLRGLGAAIGANPLLLIRPCHRVIGADGGMRGYAAGVEQKQALLTHEGALQPMLG